MFYIGAMGIAFALARLFTNIDLDLEKTVVAMTIVSIPVFYKICSKMLYEEEAYLYQSFPVSPMETVIAKITVTATAMIIFAIGSSLTKPSVSIAITIFVLKKIMVSTFLGEYRLAVLVAIIILETITLVSVNAGMLKKYYKI